MKTKSWKWVLVVSILIIVAFQLEINSTKYEFPPQYEINFSSFYKQPDGVSCGPTSLMMVLKYYGKDVSLDIIRKHAKTDFYVKNGIEIGGTTPEYEQIAMSDLGVPCKIRSLKIDALKYYVSQNKPVVALVRSGNKYWHWLVVIGYTENTIIMADPGSGQKETLPTDRFEKSWDFSSDLEGHDLTIKCKICDGTGYWNKTLGPIGKCDICGGTGKVPDWYWVLVTLGELKGHICIIPN